MSGAAGKQVLQSGDLSGGMFWAGMVQGLIHDIPSVQELLDQIMDEANDILTVRFKTMSA